MSLRAWILHRSETPQSGLFKYLPRYLLTYFLPSLLLLWGAVFITQWINQVNVERLLSEEANRGLQGVEALWRHELGGVIDDLRLLSRHDALVQWLQQGDRAAQGDLEQAWYYFAAAKRLYAKVRFIDASGMERVRIEYRDGGAESVAPEALSDESHRDYFTAGMQLAEGGVYSSPLELNRDPERKVPPLRPTLRVVTPVFVQDERRGVVVVDLRMETLLSLDQASTQTGPTGMMILNADGRYLRRPHVNREWDDRVSDPSRDPSFPQEHAVAWQRMQGPDTGGFYLDEQGYVYRKLRFPWAFQASLMLEDRRLWYFVSLITAADLAQAKQDAVTISYGFAVVVSLLLLLFLVLYTRLSQAKEGHLLSASNLGAQLQAVMDAAPDAIFTFDATGRVESFNEATLRMFACDEEAFRGARLQDLMPEDRQELEKLIHKSLEREEAMPLTVRREFNARRFNGDWFPLEFSMRETDTPELHSFIAIARDISERKAVEEQIQRRALYDDLTNLPNRLLLHAKLESLIALSQRRGLYGALLFMDLDNFKNINDSMGHLAGDMLLCRVAERLTRSLRSEDLVSRLGGDEFVAVLPLLSSDASQASVTAREVAEKLRQALNQPLMLEGHEYVTTPSIGIVLFPTEGMSADDVLRQADTAMYRAKAAGRNTIRFFHPSMQAEVNDRLRVGKELRIAVEQGELELYLQPQVDAEFDCIVGAEVLIRWNHPVRGLLGPGLFIPHAEELGMIGLVGEWSLREGFKILQHLLRDRPCQGLERLAINLSPRHFLSPEFIPRLRDLMAEYQVPPHRIELEITENLLMEDLDEAMVKMNTIREMGIRFAIDDFGTGFSSLAYLRKLPMGRLKIDRSFISQVDTDTQSAAIVETILAMARIQQLAVTAEGVEREEEKRWLMQRGCSHIQGFYYSRPLPVAAFVDFCREFDQRQQTADSAGRR